MELGASVPSGVFLVEPWQPYSSQSGLAPPVTETNCITRTRDTHHRALWGTYMVEVPLRGDATFFFLRGPGAPTSETNNGILIFRSRYPHYGSGNFLSVPPCLTPPTPRTMTLCI